MKTPTKLKQRADLPKHVKDCLEDLYVKIGLPQLRDRLSMILMPQEKRVIHWDTLHDKYGHFDAAKAIVFAVAQNRQTSLARAVLELAHDLDLLGSGSYKALRSSISEPTDKRIDELPVWDASEGELSLGGEVIRRVVPRAKNLRKILNAFQEDQWKRYIDNPLPGGANSRKLNHTVYDLNKSLSGIKFFSGNSAKGIRWETV